MSASWPALAPRPTLVTGGAGFIGGEVVRSLLADGCDVTILDDLSTAAVGWDEPIRGLDGWRLVVGDVADPEAVAQAMVDCERVVHLAAATDIPGGYGRPEPDFRAGVLGTEIVCETMRRRDVAELWFASTGVVYGTARGRPAAEGDGPYRPESHYAAAKLAAEAIIAGFTHLYGWRSLVFRFGNTIGARSDHGSVHDLVVKLLREPRRLEVLGDGRQRKPYVAVDDLVAGIRHAARAAGEPFTVLNVGPEEALAVDEVAGLVIAALGLDPAGVEVVHTGGGPGGGGWRGDTPVVTFDTSALASLGWRPAIEAREAVSLAAAGIAARYRARGALLLTASERRLATAAHG